VNEDIKRRLGVDDAYLDRARMQELAELERRRARYLGDREAVDPAGRTAIIVDDGLATGATMKAAVIAMRQKGAKRICVAVPVAPKSALEEIRAQADMVVCLNPAEQFSGVGAFYDDFHQLTDEETVGLLRQIWTDNEETRSDPRMPICREVSIPPLGLKGTLCVPAQPLGLILFVHGSGSSRFSPRNVAVADTLNARGFATLLMDLLTPDEAADRSNVFDIPMLTERVVEASLYLSGEPDVSDLPLGLFGASTGAGAALLAAAELPHRFAAIVSRGGRPDLAGARLTQVIAPTLLVVGGDDTQVLDLNRKALAALGGEKLLRVVPGAGHLFEEAGALDQVTHLASSWFAHYLLADERAPEAATPRRAMSDAALVEALRKAAEPLPELGDREFARAFDRFGSARVVLLGEASHGTSEFYRARAAISRRLIERHGFSIVAVEADWPDAATVDRHVRQRPDSGTREAAFTRFPTWMWRNEEFEDFVGYLRRHNSARSPPPASRSMGWTSTA
jgi:putative phosphoribosyl transferase